MNKLKSAKQAGVLYFILFAPWIIIAGVNTYLPTVFTSSLNALVSLILNVSYIVMCNGLLEISKERFDKKFATNIKFLIFLTVLTICLNPLIEFRSEINLGINHSIQIVVAILQFIILFINGIINLRFVRNYINLQEEYGDYARKAALWNKRAGWCTVSLVMYPLGMIFSLIADYYAWRIIQQSFKANT